MVNGRMDNSAITNSYAHVEPMAAVNARPFPTFTVFHCPCCGAANKTFSTSLVESGFLFSMRCSACALPVQALISVPQISPTLGLA